MKVLILGLGQYPQGSGVSAALFFARRGDMVRVTDQKTERELRSNVNKLKRHKNVRFILGKHRLEDVRWADTIVRNPRVRPTSPEMQLAAKLGKRVESDVSLFLKRCPCPIVGITGTRGKSTTSTLVAAMLRNSGKRVWLGGNLLVSPLTFISKVRKDDLVVLELSSWLLETTGGLGLSPQFSLITNLMRDHLNTYEGMDDYAEAKAQIFRHQSPKDVVVLNGDDEYGRRWISQAPGRVLIFSRKRKTTDGWLTAREIMWRDPETGKREALLSRGSLKLLGEHNASNVIAAALLARATGATVAGIRLATKNFRGLPDRLEVLRIWKGIRFVNDTTATTPDATIAAVRALAPFSKKIHLIAGGADKALEFDEAARVLRQKRVGVTLLEGTASQPFGIALKKAGVSFTNAASLSAALGIHLAHAKAGDSILLSPGCASFGMFKNEFERGALFRKLVKRLSLLRD